MAPSPTSSRPTAAPDDAWLGSDPAWTGVRQELLDVDGRSVRVLRADAAGTASTPQLLVHGLGGSAANWIDVIAPLAAHGPVVALDLPGFGHTRLVDSDRLTVPGHVSFVRRVLDALGWESATVHGNSMGGLVATHLAARLTDPDAVRPALLEAMAADALSEDPAQLADRRRALRSSTASIARLWLEPGPTWRAIRAVEAPTLLLGGTADALVPARVLRRVLAARPDWHGRVITDRRHALMLSEPHEFLTHVEEWVAGHLRAA